MKNKTICVCVLLIILQSNTFGFHPRFRDEFYIENKTREKIVVIFEGNKHPSHYLRYDYDEENYILLSFNSGANDPDKHFRTIRSRRLFDIGFSQYNHQDFNEKTPMEKFSAFFKSILILNDTGDLLYRIDDFSKYKIEDRTKTGPGIYVLIIE